jgi:hypothetical protein
MYRMFAGGKFNGDISRWNVSNVKFMESMFENTPFNGNILEWDLSSLKSKHDIFTPSHISNTT